MNIGRAGHYPRDEFCRVGKCRGGVGVAYQLSGPFVCRRLNSFAVLRLHFPLIGETPEKRSNRYLDGG
jgi:hypothetical protein